MKKAYQRLRVVFLSLKRARGAISQLFNQFQRVKEEIIDLQGSAIYKLSLQNKPSLKQSFRHKQRIFPHQDLEYCSKSPTFLTNTCLKQFVMQKGIQGSEQYHVDSCLIGHKVAFVSLMCNFLTSLEECYIDFL
ncbi:Hypothetical_protein [Hexamita inflata]|uniref:Hypothetical_protein n=1 Tax=Hexamita inflata TaxID=28002 RepID=A0AA86UL49_9EUKA|nr:Hypothetical protein HINF_LOCUS47489 [Hexamita inflata]